MSEDKGIKLRCPFIDDDGKKSSTCIPCCFNGLSAQANRQHEEQMQELREENKKLRGMFPTIKEFNDYLLAKKLGDMASEQDIEKLTSPFIKKIQQQWEEVSHD